VKLEPWMHRAYTALRGSGKEQLYLLVGTDEAEALAAGVVLARTATQAQQMLETLDDLCARHARARKATR
jgi:hypothetical protein